MHAQTYREGEEIIKPCSEIPGKLKIKSISIEGIGCNKVHRDSTNAMLPNISALRNHMYYHALRSLLISRWRNPYSHCVESQRSGIPDLPSNRGGVPRGRRQEIPSGPARRDIVDAYNPRVVGSAAIVSRRCNKCKENMYSNHHALIMKMIILRGAPPYLLSFWINRFFIVLWLIQKDSTSSDLTVAVVTPTDTDADTAIPTGIHASFWKWRCEFSR